MAILMSVSIYDGYKGSNNDSPDYKTNIQLPAQALWYMLISRGIVVEIII